MIRKCRIAIPANAGGITPGQQTGCTVTKSNPRVHTQTPIPRSNKNRYSIDKIRHYSQHTPGLAKFLSLIPPIFLDNLEFKYL